MSETPIEDYLDELLRRTRADARTTRRLLDEASDHLHATAAELHSGGMSPQQAETEAVRRFGPVTPIVHATFRRSVLALVFETLRAALFLAGCGLVAVGISGLVALVMNLWAGRSFVGGQTVFPGPARRSRRPQTTRSCCVSSPGWSGLCCCSATLPGAGTAVFRPCFRAGLVDALGAAAFAAGTAGLAIASADQAAQTGTPGVGFPLSGALVALPATVYFCIRAARALLPARTSPHQSI